MRGITPIPLASISLFSLWVPKFLNPRGLSIRISAAFSFPPLLFLPTLIKGPRKSFFLLFSAVFALGFLGFPRFLFSFPCRPFRGAGPGPFRVSIPFSLGFWVKRGPLPHALPGAGDVIVAQLAGPLFSPSGKLLFRFRPGGSGPPLPPSFFGAPCLFRRATIPGRFPVAGGLGRFCLPPGGPGARVSPQPWGRRIQMAGPQKRVPPHCGPRG